MLALNTLTLQAGDAAVLIIGAALVVGWVVRLVRQGRWRDPLADVAVPPGGPGLGGIGVALLAFIGAQWIAASILFGGHPPRSPVEGSDAWHRLQTAYIIASAVAAIVMVGVLCITESWPRGRLGWLRSAGCAVGGLLILLPLLTAQYQMGQVIWTWLRPEVPPPIHIVLRALEHNTWGRWGIVQVIISAVVLAPIAEELFFRGIVLHAACQFSRLLWPSILFTGGLFGLVHMAQPQDVLPLVTMGTVLGYVRMRTGAIWPCILLHMLFNARTIAVAILAPEMLQTM